MSFLQTPLLEDNELNQSMKDFNLNRTRRNHVEAIKLREQHSAWDKFSEAVMPTI